MDWPVIAQVFGGLLLVAYGAIFSRLIGDQRELEKSQAEHARETANQFAALPDKYVRRDDFAQFAHRIESSLDRIEKKLDEKADKP